MSINEALGHRVPVLATAVGSMPDAGIDGRNGLLFRRLADEDVP